MEYKHGSLSSKALDASGAGQVVFATTGLIDHDGDYTFPGAFGRKAVKLMPAHQWGGPNIGVAKIFEQGDEAMADILFNLAIQSAKEWHQSILWGFKNGVEQEYSYGFDVLEDDPGFAREIGAKRAFRRLDVHEVSPVMKAAGIGTRTVCMNCGSFQKQQGPVAPVVPKHACSCNGKAGTNGAGDLTAVLAELKALRTEVTKWDRHNTKHGNRSTSTKQDGYDASGFSRRNLFCVPVF